MERTIGSSRISHAGAAFLALTLAAVAQPSFASYRRFYSGPPLPRSQVSFIIESGDDAFICDINGVAFHETFWTLSGMTGAELLPGQYTISARYERKDKYVTETEITHAGCTQPRVILEAGRTYVLRSQLGLRMGAFRPVLFDVGASWESWGLKPGEERYLRKEWELRDALAQVKALKGMLPICAACKKVRDDQGYWQQIESYVATHSEAEFSHGICPECADRLYPSIMKRLGRAGTTRDPASENSR